MTLQDEHLELVGEVPMYVTNVGIATVIVCEFCGQPLGALGEVCNSAIHVGTDGSGAGTAVTSAVLAARLRRRS